MSLLAKHASLQVEDDLHQHRRQYGARIRRSACCDGLPRCHVSYVKFFKVFIRRFFDPDVHVMSVEGINFLWNTCLRIQLSSHQRCSLSDVCTVFFCLRSLCNRTYFDYTSTRSAVGHARRITEKLIARLPREMSQRTLGLASSSTAWSAETAMMAECVLSVSCDMVPR